MNQPADKAPVDLKEAALAFVTLAAEGNAREAFSKFVGPVFRHHNPFYRGDAESLMIAMEKNAVRNPDRILQVHHVVRDGDLVAVHSHIRQNPMHAGASVIHIFRFEGNRIAELWDVGQPVPETSPNEHGMF